MTDLFNQLRAAIDAGIPDEVLSDAIDEITTSYKNHQRWKAALDKNKALIPLNGRVAIFDVLKHRRARIVPEWSKATRKFLRGEGQ